MIAGAAVLAALASAPGARAWAWSPTTPVAPPPADEREAPVPPPAVPETGARPQPPLPEVRPPEATPPETPPSESAPPVAVPPPQPIPEPLAPPAPESLPPETVGAVVLAREPVRRPRLSAAVGMGATFDSVGFADGNVHTIPAFFTVLGIGDGLLFGFDLGAFASQASGRHNPQSPVDRLALDAFGVVRPAAGYRAVDQRYEMRILHALAAELGVGFERDGRSAISGTRFVIHTGARVDLPLSPAGEPTDLRLRLAVRRAFGLYTPQLRAPVGSQITGVGDSAAEIYAALVVVF